MTNHKLTLPTIPRAYRITAEMLGPAVEKVAERRRKVSQGLVFLDKKTYDNASEYLKFLQRKFPKLPEWGKVFAAQMNHLNDVWLSATGENESYESLRKVKACSQELVETLNLLEKDWEEFFSVDPPNDLQNLHLLVCELYDRLFTNVKSYIDKTLQVIANPEDFTSPGDRVVDLRLPLNLMPDDLSKKLEKELQRVEKEIKQRQPFGWLAALVYFFVPFTIVWKAMSGKSKRGRRRW